MCECYHSVVQMLEHMQYCIAKMKSVCVNVYGQTMFFFVCVFVFVCLCFFKKSAFRKWRREMTERISGSATAAIATAEEEASTSCALEDASEAHLLGKQQALRAATADPYNTFSK